MKDPQLRLKVRPSGVRVGKEGVFQWLWLQTWHVPFLVRGCGFRHGMFLFLSFKSGLEFSFMRHRE